MFPILESMKHYSMNPIHLRAMGNRIVTPLLDELDIRERMIKSLAEMAAVYRDNWMKARGVTPEQNPTADDFIAEVIDDIKCDDSIKP